MKHTHEEHIVEKIAPSLNGMAMLIILILGEILTLFLFGFSIFLLARSGFSFLYLIVLILSTILSMIFIPLSFMGLKVLKPKEALVLTLFGRYYGTIKKDGIFFVHPFVSAINPCAKEENPQTSAVQISLSSTSVKLNKKVSLKAMTLNNEKQKINDALGNPIIIGIVVIWRVVNSAKAVFNVENYKEYLSTQTDSALRNIVRLYPYDENDAQGEKSLRGSSLEVADKLRDAIQEKAEIAGIEILEARITHLSYAPEIAAAMLQRQQASAIIAARSMIVEGAVSMVEMALEQLSMKEIVALDEERKATMVSNLLVVLCGNKDAQPIVNSGSIY